MVVAVLNDTSTKLVMVEDYAIMLFNDFIFSVK